MNRTETTTLINQADIGQTRLHQDRKLAIVIIDIALDRNHLSVDTTDLTKVSVLGTDTLMTATMKTDTQGNTRAQNGRIILGTDHRGITTKNADTNTRMECGSSKNQRLILIACKTNFSGQS